MKEYTEYELIYIIPLKKFESISSIIEGTKAIIEKHGGQVKKASDPQKRKLAYPIKGARNGVYVINRLMLEKNAVQKVEHDLKLENDILRFMIVSAKELPTTEQKEAVAEREKAQAQEEKAASIKTEDTAPAKPAADSAEIKPETATKKEEKAETEKIEKPAKEEIKPAKEEKKAEKKEKTATKEESKEEDKEKEPKKEKLKFEELDKKIDDILKDDLI